MDNIPRVEIYQKSRTTTYTGRRPILVPTLIGPCFQIMDVFDPATGVVNSKAKAGYYDPSNQDPSIYAYPNLNPDAEVIADTVKVYFRFGDQDNTLTEVEAASITSTGVTLGPGLTSNPAQVFISYRALKKGVLTRSASPTGGSCGVLLQSIEDVDTYLGSADPRNPLGFAAWIALSISNITVRCMGVNEVVYSQSDGDYNGTVNAYSEALEGLETCEDPYVLVPLTHNESVLSLVKTHVEEMSKAKVGQERIAFICPDRFDTYPDTVIISGIGSVDDTNTNQFNIDADPSDVDPTYDVLVIADESGEFTITSVHSNPNYLVVDGDLTGITNRSYSVIRKGKPCNTPSEVAEAIGSAASSYKSKRVRYVFPPSSELYYNGVETIVPSYYVASALATMRCTLSPSKPLTGFQIPLFSGVRGSDNYLTKTNMDSMVGNGVWILVNQGGYISTLRAVTTDNTSVENLEDNIVCQVDYVSKMLRIALRPFLGGNVITPEFIKYAVKPVVASVINSCKGAQAIGDVKIRYIRQSETSPDTLEIVADVTPLYSLNVITITLYI